MILDLLSESDFPEKKWFDLGLALGLSKNTLEVIETNNQNDVHRCLINCLSKWLERVDDAKEPTLNSLSEVLRPITGAAVAGKFDKKSELI